MKKILIVDDSPSIRRTVCDILVGEDFSVDQAEDGLQGLEVAKSGSYDLIISDYHMPKMIGMSLVKELRNIEQYKKIPILVCSSESDPNLKKKGKEIGVSGWLLKPIDKINFEQNVRKLLKM